MRTFFKWGLLLSLAFVLVFIGFLWVLSGTTTQRPSIAQPALPAQSKQASTAADLTRVQSDAARVAGTASESESNPQPDPQPDPALAPAQQLVVDDTDALASAPEVVAEQTAAAPDDGVNEDSVAQDSDSPGEDRGDSYIAGRVLDNEGKRLSNVTVLAQRKLGASESGNSMRTTSDARGHYRFDSIAKGDYTVSNGSVPGYGETNQFVSAGSASVDLVLQRLRKIQVVGTVSDPDGRPIPQVEVNAAGSEEVIKTGTNGAFAVNISIQSSHSTSLRFTRNGFSERIEAVNAKQVDGSNRIVVNATMKPLGNISYRGRVVDNFGTAVSGELVRLYSSDVSQAQRATTDENGNFEVTGLTVSQDWRLAIIPKSNYERYESEQFAIEESIDVGDIVLTATDSARISGSIVDFEGNAMPNVSLLFTPTAAPGNFKTSTADETGRFAVEEIAAGEIRVSTQARPHMDITGITLVPGDDSVVRLVLDKGPHEISGVVTAGGSPLVNAQIHLIWSHQESGLTSTSFRETQSADDGSYRFTDLGQGTHQLSVTHETHGGRVDKSINVGSDSVEHNVDLN